MAKAFRDTFRPQLPVIYFNMRTNQPVPPIASHVENEIPIEQERSETDDQTVETKPILIPAQMDECDIAALNELILTEDMGDENDIDPGEEIDPLSTTTDEQLSSTHEEQVKATEKIDDDIEMTYIVGQILLPTVQSQPLAVKDSDELSGRMPYQGILDHRDVSIEKKYSFVMFLTFFYSLDRNRTSIFGGSWNSH